MRLTTIRINSSEESALVTTTGVIPVRILNQQINQRWPITMLDFITSGQLKKVNDWYRHKGKDFLRKLKDFEIPLEQVNYAPLYRHPAKIWGIGLNYVEHAGDLLEKVPTIYPASFMKPDTTIIGHRDTINIPLHSEKTTGEAELGIIVEQKCKNVARTDWLSIVAGFTCIIDVTAEDILQKNPRYLTLAKSFDTFFSLGPHLVTPDEIEDISRLKVATVINGYRHAENAVSNMTFPPDYLVAFHSEVMTLLPGDIISTGTPRAVQIKDGDVIECQINGFSSLINLVHDMKTSGQKQQI